MKTRYKGFSGPVGSGKSLAFGHEALRLAYANPGCTGLIAAPTYGMLRDSTLLAFLEILEENGVPHVYRKQANKILLPEPASQILCRSLDQPERLRGTNLAWFGVDELTYAKQESWNRLQGRLRQRRARELHAFGSWTPKGFDWVHGLFIAREGKKADLYGVVLAKPFENAKNNAEGYYESLESYDERFYKQEVLGEYLNVFSGQVYYTFDRTAHLKPVEFDPRFPLVWALDFNIDPMCSVLGQVIDTTTPAEQRVGKRSRIFHVIDEIALPDARTITAVNVFLDRVEKLQEDGKRVTQIHLHGDSSGTQRQRASPDADWDVVKRELRQKLDIPVLYRVPKKQPGVRARTTAVCGQLRANSGEIGMLVNPRCRELAKDLEQVAWKREMNGAPIDEIDKKNPQRTHLSDALGYWVVWERQPEGGHQSSDLI